MLAVPLEQRQMKRVLRQHVMTDMLLGVASVPVRRRRDPVVSSNAATMESSGSKSQRLAIIQNDEVAGCPQCPLCESRLNTVFGEGDPDAQLMFIGEGPGVQEDRQGRPFVGPAGEMLNKQIAAIGLTRDEVYIANVVKCRPPGNRTPSPVEVATCWDYLRRQIGIIRPEVIVTLGGPATKQIVATTTGITALRGSWQEFTGLAPDGPVIPVMPTFHPAYLLRAYTPENRRYVWSDLQSAVGRLSPR